MFSSLYIAISIMFILRKCMKWKDVPGIAVVEGMHPSTIDLTASTSLF